MYNSELQEQEMGHINFTLSSLAACGEVFRQFANFSAYKLCIWTFPEGYSESTMSKKDLCHQMQALLCLASCLSLADPHCAPSVSGAKLERQQPLLFMHHYQSFPEVCKGWIPLAWDFSTQVPLNLRQSTQNTPPNRTISFTSLTSLSSNLSRDLPTDKTLI